MTFFTIYDISILIYDQDIVVQVFVIFCDIIAASKTTILHLNAAVTLCMDNLNIKMQNVIRAIKPERHFALMEKGCGLFAAKT